MDKKQWIKIRILLICLLIIITLGALIKTFIFPINSDKYQSLNVKFPEKILLPQWKLITSKKLPAKSPNYKNGYEYKYQNGDNQQLMNVQIRYEPKTDGNVSRLINVYQKIKPATIRWQIKSYKKGFYSIFNYEDKMYLTACLKNNGYTTVTEQQFYANSFENYIKPLRLFFWLIGLKPLTDSECYFILSTTKYPVNSTKYQSFNLIKIETFWQEWINQFSKILK